MDQDKDLVDRDMVEVHFTLHRIEAEWLVGHLEREYTTLSPKLSCAVRSGLRRLEIAKRLREIDAAIQALNAERSQLSSEVHL